MRIVAVLLAAAVLASTAGGSTELMFHHIHYRVGDPSAAMSEAVRRFGGIREIVQGLGVGVRLNREYLLFDRDDFSARPAPQPSFAAGYQMARQWLGKVLVVISPVEIPPFAMAELPLDHIAFRAPGVDFELVTERLSALPLVTEIARNQDSVLFDLDGLRLEIVRDTFRSDVFWCPMHPDIRSPDAGKCSLCAMDLVPIPPPKLGEYKLDVVVDRTARGARGLRFTVREPDTLATVRDFAVVHEKRFHLFIVSRDLTYFAHVHPDEAPDGSFVLEHELPRGEYMLIADFLPQGGTSQMVQRAIFVGEPAPEPKEPPAADLSLTRSVDGLHVALNVEDFAPGKHACLTFSLTDAKSGQPVGDLQPYLGAPAHMLLVRADLADVVHAHPEELETRGPVVSFHPLVPAPGDYKLWVQFQRAGRVITVPFMVSASR